MRAESTGYGPVARELVPPCRLVDPKGIHHGDTEVTENYRNRTVLPIVTADDRLCDHHIPIMGKRLSVRTIAAIDLLLRVSVVNSAPQG